MWLGVPHWSRRCLERLVTIDPLEIQYIYFCNVGLGSEKFTDDNGVYQGYIYHVN